jgi:chromosome segregation ATPase
MFINDYNKPSSPTTAKEPATVYKTGSIMDLQERIEGLKRELSRCESDLATSKKLIASYERRIEELEQKLKAYEGNGHEKKSAV